MKFYKKIKDERLLFKQLKNIRIAFLFENICLIGLLIFYGFKNGFVNVTQNPLWLIVVLTSVVLIYLQMPISIDMNSNKSTKNKQGSYYVKLFYSLAIGMIVGLIMVLSGSQVQDALITGSVIFICFLISGSLMHYLRKKHSQDLDD